MSTKKPDNNKPENDIRISMNSRPRYVIKYALSILKEKNFKELVFSAVGGSIGRLLDIVEVLKVKIPDGVYQQNRITSVAYQTVDSNSTVLNQRLYPKLEVTLSTVELKTKNEGTQEKLDEKQRKEIEKIMDERKEQREKGRGRGRRGGFRGASRGRRGGFRGRRRGFRGRGRGGAPRRGGQRSDRGDRGAVRSGVPRRGRGRAQRGGPRVNRGRGREQSSK